ncbi:MAG: hypothetical protein JWL84_712 [Rhodospirillales bacterium]|jgi:hypothetical protein|nr:hypothetical protein [Rhodospirillales bacterium]
MSGFGRLSLASKSEAAHIEGGMSRGETEES